MTKKSLISLLFIITVFITTRQFPFSFLSPLMNMAVIAMVAMTVFYWFVKEYRLLSLLILPLTLSLVYSIFFTDNKVNEVLRFYIILISVGLAYFITVNKLALKWFIWLSILQASLLICLFLYVSLVLGQTGYIPLRLFFLDQGWGDIYTYNGIFYRIQIKGSALLIVAFILTIESNLIKRKLVPSLILLIGIILAGNFAFLMALSIYFLIVVFRLKNTSSVNHYLLRILTFFVLILSFSSVIFNYVDRTLEDKQEGSTSARVDQVAHLTRDVAETPFTLLLGQGLGNTLSSKSDTRDYTGKTYYELQVYYIFNQLGLLFFFVYLMFHIWVVIKRWGWSEIVLYYLIYVSYAITNPYIIDTTHIIVIIVLNSWFIYAKNDRSKELRNGDYSPISA